MKSNHKEYLDAFYYRIIDIRHTASRINSVLNADVERLLKSDVEFISGSALVISDWTGPTDNGWEINFHTGVSMTTINQDYRAEVDKIISTKCCLSYAQAFEALERFFKDCVYISLLKDSNHKEKLGYDKDFTRNCIPGGENLFKLLKKIYGERLKESSQNNNKNIRFKEFWSVLSEVRHAIVHSSSYIKAEKVNKTKYHLAVFNHLYNYTICNDTNWLVVLDYKKLDRLLKYVAEFGYQIFKIHDLNEVINS
ncbi:hypothetical protein [Pontibacter populi]|uniref:RiboL-PSP-HEPN domain-containing protein n=1 Tax=Pontibacter populi TaxID=890055 RepID=A0ABV1RNT8_9BACT